MNPQEYIVLLHCKAIAMVVRDLEGRNCNSIEFYAIEEHLTYASDYLVCGGQNYRISDQTTGRSINFQLDRIEPWEGNWLSGIDELEDGEIKDRFLEGKNSKTLLPKPGHKFRLIAEPSLHRLRNATVKQIVEVPEHDANDRVWRKLTGHTLEPVDISVSSFDLFLRSHKDGRYAEST